MQEAIFVEIEVSITNGNCVSVVIALFLTHFALSVNNVVVERVAYAHPVRDHQAYYAPKGKNQYEQRQPPPIPPHPNQNQVGFPFYGGSGYSNSSSGGGVAPQPGSGGSGIGPPDSGRARVRREHNSECVLYDPAESVVVRFLNF